MEQKKTKELINDAQTAANAQKKSSLKLTEQKTVAENEKLLFKKQLTAATNTLAAAKTALSKAEQDHGKMAADLQSSQTAQATLQSELTIAQQGLAVKATELQAALTDREAANAKLVKTLADANRTHAEKTIELEKASKALKPFLSTGLTPAQIKELQQKRPVEIAVPRFIAPKPIKPGKLSEPIQQNVQTP